MRLSVKSLILSCLLTLTFVATNFHPTPVQAAECRTTLASVQKLVEDTASDDYTLYELTKEEINVLVEKVGEPPTETWDQVYILNYTPTGSSRVIIVYQGCITVVSNPTDTEELEQILKGKRVNG